LNKPQLKLEILRTSRFYSIKYAIRLYSTFGRETRLEILPTYLAIVRIRLGVER
jgi:hypothetical protein